MQERAGSGRPGKHFPQMKTDAARESGTPAVYLRRVRLRQRSTGSRNGRQTSRDEYFGVLEEGQAPLPEVGRLSAPICPEGWTA